MDETDFIKMHGLGNDFVIIGKTKRLTLSSSTVKEIADRKKGIGCDQVITLAASDKADVKMEIFNSDGSKAEACGNATRCVAKIAMDQNSTNFCTIEFNNIISKCKKIDNLYSCTMGKPKTNWQDIPLSKDVDSIYFPEFNLHDGFTVNIGNPHIVFFVDSDIQSKMRNLGPKIENHSLFPQKVNVSFANIINDKEIKLRVWERGAGATHACGTAACATAYAAFKKGLTPPSVKVMFEHGFLSINVLKDDTIEMIGEAIETYRGKYQWMKK